MKDIDICNVALARIGQRQFIASFADNTIASQLCNLLYPLARDSLLRKAQWRFATITDSLILWNAGDALPQAWDPTVSYLGNAQVTFNGAVYHSRNNGFNLGNQPIPRGSGSMLDTKWEPGYSALQIPGWGYIYQLKPPVAILAPQYIFTGARPGQPLAPSLDYLNSYGVAGVDQLPMINGAIPAAPFVIQGSYLYCDLPDAQLVYTKATTDPVGDNWPELFCNAVASRLAIDLALGDSKKPGLAKELSAWAAAALSEALAAESNNETPDMRPDSSFISIRG